MERTFQRRVGWLLLLAASAAAAVAQSANDVPMKAMRDEMARSMSMQLPGLAKPYFLAYRMQDVSDTSIVASLGGLVADQSARSRLLRVELRVGDYELDNTNFLSFASRGINGASVGQQISLDDDYREIRRQIWLATDTEYKKAVEQFTAKQATLNNQNHGDDLADLTQEHPNQYFEKARTVVVNAPALEALARETSAVFRQMPELQTSRVTFDVHNVYTRYLNSEGTEFKDSSQLVFVQIDASVDASDGVPIEDSEQVFLSSPSDFSRDELASRAQQMIARLQKLRTAGSLERYNGPVLFEDEAGAEIFAQLFAPALVASRNPMTDNPRGEAFLEQMSARFGGGTLTDKLGGRVLPDFVTLTDNPKLDSLEGKRLLGAYSVDDDGVPARVNTVVQSGILKLLLSSRTPISGVTQSTGNRRGFTAAPSNLILTSTKSSSNQQLRRMLLDRAQARGIDYGIVVRRAGGSADQLIQTAMSMMQGASAAGNNMLEVYKLYPDGREELTHGEQLPSMSAQAFKDIVAVGDKPVVYDCIFIPGFTSLMMIGMTGDVSGAMNMPVVSYVIPSLLFDEVTMKRASGPFPKPPVSAPPTLSLKGN